MSKVVVRRGRRADAAEFLELLRSLAKFEKLEPPTEEGLGRLVADTFDKRKLRLFVASQEKQLVGYALCFFTYSSFLARPTLYIEDFFVREEHRGEGVGYALFARCANEATKAGCGRMEWAVLDWNKSAIRFYERAGAKRLREWRHYRLAGDELKNVGSSHRRPHLG